MECWVYKSLAQTYQFAKSSESKQEKTREFNFLIFLVLLNMDVDVFITNFFYVDPEIFQCWLEGLTR